MGHGHTPPQLPEVTDEAGESPTWLPWLGAALFALAIGWVVMRHAGGDDTAPSDAGEAAVEAGAH